MRARIGQTRHDARAIKLKIDAVRHDSHREIGQDHPQGLAISFRDGDDAIRHPADAPLICDQLLPLHKRVSGAQPASRLAHIGQKRPLLQQILGVVVVEHQERTVRLQRQRVARHLDPFDLDHVIAVLAHQPGHVRMHGGTVEPQRHVGPRAEQRIAPAAGQRAHRRRLRDDLAAVGAEKVNLVDERRRTRDEGSPALVFGRSSLVSQRREGQQVNLVPARKTCDQVEVADGRALRQPGQGLRRNGKLGGENQDTRHRVPRCGPPTFDFGPLRLPTRGRAEMDCPDNALVFRPTDRRLSDRHPSSGGPRAPKKMPRRGASPSRAIRRAAWHPSKRARAPR